MFNTDYVTPQNVVDTLTGTTTRSDPLDLSKYISTGSERKAVLWRDPAPAGLLLRAGQREPDDDLRRFRHLLRPLPVRRVGGRDPEADPSDLPPSALRTPIHATAGRFSGRTPISRRPAVLDQLVVSFGVPEAWLISSDVKVPKSKHGTSVSVIYSQLAVSVTYAGVRGVNQLTLNWPNFGLKPQRLLLHQFQYRSPWVQQLYLLPRTTPDLV